MPILLFIRVRRELVGGATFEECGFFRRLDLGLAFGLDFLAEGGLGGCSWDAVHGIQGNPFANRLSERTASHQSSTVPLSTIGCTKRARLRGR